MNQHDYTNEQRIEVVRDYLTHGGFEKTADKYGVSKSSVERWVRKYRHQIEYGTKEDQKLKGVSTYTPVRDDEGVLLSATWTKVDIEHEDMLAKLRDFADGIKEDVPRAAITKEPEGCEEDLLNMYVLTDAHIGMRSDEWDLNTAEKVIKGWINYVAKRTPDSHTGLLCIQGDMSHWDSMVPVTPAHRHVLDADCNSRTMVRTVIHLVRYCIKVLLEKHKHVHVMYVVGNHDEFTATVQSEWLDAHYEDEPRISVDVTNSLYHCYEWGDVSLFTHHGHKRRIGDITKVFASMFRDVFGRTKYSYGHIGHYHHVKADEDQLMQIQIHPTLSGKDDYANFGGWISQRGAKAIVYHKKYGEVDTATGRPEMFL